MSLFHRGKDGGSKSTVSGFWFPEIKRLFSIALLKFSHGSRDEYHSHAFFSISWVLWGKLKEEFIDGTIKIHRPSLFPVITRRSTMHRVFSEGTTIVITFRGPWTETWEEYDPKTQMFSVLGKRRTVLDTWKP